MHLRYIISLYASFVLNLSEDEYTQFSRNTCCCSSSIYHVVVGFFSPTARRQQQRVNGIKAEMHDINISISKGKRCFCRKGSAAAAGSRLLGVTGPSEAASLATGMLR